MTRETAFLLVLASGFFHALWNWIANTYGPKGDEKDPAVLASRVSLSRVLLFEALFSVLPAMLPMAWQYPPISQWGTGIFFAGVGETVFLFTLMWAYRLASAGPAYAIVRGSAAVLGIPLGILLFHEKWETLRLLGVLGAMAAMAGLKPPRGGNLMAITYALLTGVTIVCYTAGFKAAEQGGLLPVQSQLLGMAPLGLVAAWLLWRDKQPFFRPLDTLAGFFTWLSFFLFLTALGHVGAGEAIVIRNVSLIFVEGLDQFSQRRFSPWRLALSLGLMAALSLVALGGR